MKYPRTWVESWNSDRHYGLYMTAEDSRRGRQAWMGGPYTWHPCSEPRDLCEEP